jgi:hypothetical protein
MAVALHPGRFDLRFLGAMIRAEDRRALASVRLTDRAASLPVSLLSPLPLDALVPDLARATVLDHELRHFHDALLYPFGAAVLRQRLFAGVNGAQVLVELRRRREKANALPIPLQSWLRLDSRGRDAFLAMFTDRPRVVPDLPVVDADDDLGDLPVGVLQVEDEERLILSCRIALNAYRGSKPSCMPRIGRGNVLTGRPSCCGRRRECSASSRRCIA